MLQKPLEGIKTYVAVSDSRILAKEPLGLAVKWFSVNWVWFSEMQKNILKIEILREKKEGEHLRMSVAVTEL